MLAATAPETARIRTLKILFTWEQSDLARGQTRVESSRPPFPRGPNSRSLCRQTSLSSGHKMLALFEYWGKRMLKAGPQPTIHYIRAQQRVTQ